MPSARRFSGYLLVSAGAPLWLAVPLVCGAGVLAALLMGFAELKTGLSSFVVTLAFLSVYTGGALLVTGGQQFQITSPTLSSLGNGTLLSPAVCPLVGLAVACGVGVLAALLPQQPWLETFGGRRE